MSQSSGQPPDTPDQVRIERRYRHLLEAAPDAILEVDEAGRIVLMNAATERMFGYARHELFGQNVDILVPTEVRPRHTRHRGDYAANPLPRPMGSGLLLQGQRKDGSRFPVEISLSPFNSGEGARVGAIIRDISERTNADEQIRALHARYTEELTAANRQLELRNREVEAANQLKSEFLASISHELRTPLHAIIGFAELLSEQLDSSSQAKELRFVGHILRDGQHLLSLINDILDVSKIEAGQLELKLETFDWTDAFSDAVAAIQPQAIAMGVELSPPGNLIASYIRADRVRFKAILYNLLSNAVKFTPAGGRVWVETRLEEEAIVLAVNDTGVGIPAEQQTRIFDKFYQVGMTTKGVREGTGLGLAITKHLVELHGGTISVDSIPGKGSSFTVTIPRAREIEVASPQQLGAAKRPLLLILQPNPEAREALVSFLEPQGYRTQIADGLQDVLSKARDLRPDIIALDLIVSGSEGWKTLWELRHLPETSRIPVLLVSASGEERDAANTGAAAYVSKPIDRELLLGTVQQYVQSRPGKPPKILVVDDDPCSRELIQDVLGSAGYLPIVNSSGREALETLAKTQVSAVIVDLLMPEMSGLEFIFRVKEHRRFQDLPLLVLTAKELTGTDHEMLRRDARAVFLKSSTWRDDLLEQLRSLAPSVTGPRWNESDSL